MPKAAFADLWSKLKQDDSWRGIVKNRCKNGDYYWVDAYVTPLYENGKMIGYQSVRTLPSQEQKKKLNSFMIP
jgi:aerotaxis receptor